MSDFKTQNFISVWIVIWICQNVMQVLPTGVVWNYIEADSKPKLLVWAQKSADIDILYKKGTWIKGLQAQ